jgi:hypothetical protein
LTGTARQLLRDHSQLLEKPLQNTGGLASPQILSKVFLDGNPTSVPPKSTVPEVQDSTAKIWPQAKRRKIRYGPFRIPPTSEKNVFSELLNVKGMSNKYTFGIKKPCDGKCTILAVEADLEHVDGSRATNADGVS